MAKEKKPDAPENKMHNERHEKCTEKFSEMSDSEFYEFTLNPANSLNERICCIAYKLIGQGG